MIIYIKNMVCNRCIAAVKHIFEQEQIHPKSVQLGEVEIDGGIEDEKWNIVHTQLQHSGFEILEDQSQKIIEKIKTAIIDQIAQLSIEEDFKLSEFISNQLHREYSAISKLFSQHENITLEQFFILQKIEKVKELLAYQEYTLTEISVMLGYKSVQHLSSQFRKMTGFSPSEFSKLKNKHRKSLDEI